MNRKPADAAAESARVSPMAPDTKSASTNVWRLLETMPDFNEGMDRARSDFESGRVAPFKHRVPRPDK